MPDVPALERSQISLVLQHFGSPLLKFLAVHDIRFSTVGSERYVDRSPALSRMHIDVDRWPNPPAGLFVLEERTIYLRSTSAMTIAHEVGHAFDCALGNETYWSLSQPTVRKAYINARTFVTPYAATALDEYFAEGFRAWFGCNDDRSLWPKVCRDRLRKVDPALFRCIQDCLYTHHLVY